MRLMLQMLADAKPLICNGIQYRNRIIDIMENGPGPFSTPPPGLSRLAAPSRIYNHPRLPPQF